MRVTGRVLCCTQISYHKKAQKSRTNTDAVGHAAELETNHQQLFGYKKSSKPEWISIYEKSRTLVNQSDASNGK